MLRTNTPFRYIRIVSFISTLFIIITLEGIYGWEVSLEKQLLQENFLCLETFLEIATKATLINLEVAQLLLKNAPDELSAINDALQNSTIFSNEQSRCVVISAPPRCKNIAMVEALLSVQQLPIYRFKPGILEITGKKNCYVVETLYKFLEQIDKPMILYLKNIDQFTATIEERLQKIFDVCSHNKNIFLIIETRQVYQMSDHFKEIINNNHLIFTEDDCLHQKEEIAQYYMDKYPNTFYKVDKTYIAKSLIAHTACTIEYSIECANQAAKIENGKKIVTIWDFNSTDKTIEDTKYLTYFDDHRIPVQFRQPDDPNYIKPITIATSLGGAVAGYSLYKYKKPNNTSKKKQNNALEYNNL